MNESPWLLPRLEPEVARLYNRLAAGRPCLCLSAPGSGKVRLVPDFPESLGRSDETSVWDTELALDLDGEQWALVFSAPAFFLPLPEDVSPTELPAELRLALCESCLEPWLDALAAYLVCEVRLLGLRLGEGAGSVGTLLEARTLPIRFSFVILDNNGREAGRGLLRCPDTARSMNVWKRIVRAFPRARADLSALSLPLSLCAADGHFPLSVLRAAAHGDILLFPSPGLLAGILTLECGQRPLWFATLSDGVVTIRGSMASPSAREPVMDEERAVPEAMYNESTEAQAAEAPLLAPADLDALEVRLTLELEERLITVGELASVAPGHIFVTSADPRNPVILKLNGKKVGQGTLVDVGGRLGVMVAELSIP